MGSLLPGWDTDRHEESVGIKQELQSEKEFLEYEMYGGRDPTVGGRRSIGGREPTMGARKSIGSREPTIIGRKSIEGVESPMAAITGPPTLARKSAPSSILDEQLQREEEEEELTLQKQQTIENIANTTNKLYARDKWWRKFSSANLNDLANDIEKQYGKDTYVPQFDIAGGSHYTNQA